MSNDIGIGFVGAGGNTKLRHLPGFSAIDGVRLVSVANRSEASSRAIAEEFGVERTAIGWQEIVADPEVDAICIGTWPNLHAEVSIAALEAGKHVLTEARMAATLTEARSMLEASKARPKQVAQIVPSPFTLDLDATVIEMLNSRKLGDMREIFIDHANAANLDPTAPLNWRQDRQYSGINKLTMGIYHEVIQRWFKEAFDVHSVCAKTYTRQRVHLESGETVAVEIPDTLHILGSMGTDALLNYHFSSTEPGPGRNEIRLVGSLGTLLIDVANQAMYLSVGSGNEDLVEVAEASQRGWRVEEDFINSIRNGAPVELTSFADGVRYMEFTDKVDRANSSC